MNPTPTRHAARLLAAMSLVAVSASAQTIWTGNGDSNASGLWNTASNWSTNSVPGTGNNIRLNDVTSGSRTVTSSGTNAVANTVTFNQTTSTPGVTNTFSLQNSLTLSAAGTAFETNLGSGVGVDQVVTTLSGDGRIILGAGGAENVGLINRGTFNLTNGPSSGNAAGFIARSQTAANRDLSFQNFGVLNMGSASGAISLSDGGAVIGGFGTQERRYDTVVTNAGTINVTNVATIGTLNTASTSNGAATLTNSSGGTVNIGNGSTLQLASRSNSNGSKTSLVSNEAGATINLGVSGDASSNGRLVLTHRTNSAFTGSADAPAISNSGTINLHGTSRAEFVQFTNLTAQFASFVVTNTSTGVINLNDASRIGNSSKDTIFTNDGLLVKSGAGISEIQSAASGTNANTGVIHIRDGALSFSRGLNSTNGDLRFDLGAADITAARLVAPSLTLSNSILELVFTTANLGNERSWNLWDATVSGTFTSVNLSGSGFSGSYGDISAFSSNNYNFSLDVATGILTAQVIPEPSAFAALAGLGALGFAASRRRRR